MNHPFLRTLGIGPYRFVGFIEIVFSPTFGAKAVGDTHLNPEAGVGTCAHCGHAIINCYIVETGERRRFGVGSDCILKVWADCGQKTPTDFEILKRKIARDKRQTRKQAKRVASFERALALAVKYDSLLSSRPHPSISSLTLKDYSEYCLRIRSVGKLLTLLEKFEDEAI